jgi:hypothetical protein
LAASLGHGKVRRMKAAILLAILLAACGKQTPQPANEAKTAEPVAKPAAPAAKAFAYEEENDFIEFHYAWSAETAAIPQLETEFRAEMDRGKSKLLELSKSDARNRENGPLVYAITKDIKTAGQAGRLLSLEDSFYEFTGGAHGNHGTKGLLWDRLAKKEMEVADLFTAPANMDRLLTQPWCDALNKAREKKRGEPVGGGGMFDECPKLGEISIIPADKDGNGKFERLVLVADPYVAGSYAEGDYEIELPVTADLIAAIRSDYRESFEGQPQ